MGGKHPCRRVRKLKKRLRDAERVAAGVEAINASAHLLGDEVPPAVTEAIRASLHRPCPHHHHGDD